MRRLFSSFLLIVILANFAGGYTYFVIRALHIKHEIQALLRSLPDESLEVISLSIHEFNRVRVEEHEVKVNGKMYDIARIKQEGDTLHIFCVHDEAEDNLLSFLDGLLVRLQNDSTQPPASVTAFAMLQFISTEFIFGFQNTELQCLTPTPYLQTDFFVALAIDVPPPRA